MLLLRPDLASVNRIGIIEYLDFHTLICRVTLKGARIPMPLLAPAVNRNSNRNTKLPYSFSVNRFPPPSAGQTILPS